MLGTEVDTDRLEGETAPGRAICLLEFEPFVPVREKLTSRRSTYRSHVGSRQMNRPGGPLSSIEQREPQTAAQLLPFLYDELRRLAARKLAHEPRGQTLQATALVHEAYLRLVGPDENHLWDGRRHFFAAAAEAMRRILVERARGKATLKRGGDVVRLELEQVAPVTNDPGEEILALNDALNQLEENDAQAARLVELRYFAGLTHQQAAEVLGISRGLRTGCGSWRRPGSTRNSASHSREQSFRSPACNPALVHA